MKTHILTLAAFAAFTTLSLADSPDAILKDYRTRATQATQRLNETLEKQAALIITGLLRKNDTAGAEAITAQVQQKLDGDHVSPPHAAAAALFAQYDAARATAMQPIQKATLKRLDSLLNVPGGPKPEDLAALTKAKAEVDAGKITDPGSMPVEWTYHQTMNGKPDARIKLKPDGVFEIDDGSEVKTGSWKASKKNSFLAIDFNNDTWNVTIKDGVGTIQRDVGTRYMHRVTNK